MFFAAPIWLIATLPWAAVLVLWMLRRPNASAVPYLQLWRRNLAAATARRSVQTIPPQVLLIFAATLLAILATAQPMIGGRSVSARILIGDLVSPVGIAPWLDRLGETLRSKKIGMEVQSTNDSPAAVGKQTDSDLRVLITSDPAPRDDLLVISTHATQPISVMGCAFAEDPPEWMITLRNNFAAGSAKITLAGDRSISQTVNLSPPGKSQSWFLPASGLGRAARLSIIDDAGANLIEPRLIRAYSITPRLVAGGSLPKAIERFRAVYTKLHSPKPGSGEIIFSEAAAADRVALCAAAATQPAITAANIVIIPHAITAHLSPKALQDLPMTIAAEPSPDWRVVASIDGRPILAVREAPAREVWLGFSSADFEQGEGFVVLLASIVDWLNHAEVSGSSADTDDASASLPEPRWVAEQIEQRVSRARDGSPGLCLIGLALVAGAIPFVSPVRRKSILR